MMEQILKPTILFFILNCATSLLYASDPCFWKSDKTDCNILISTEPIARVTLVQRLGETMETCLNYFEKFDWDIGVYCPELGFCGLGLDLSENYRSMWKREEFLPAKHTCSLITDTKQNTCDELIVKMHTAGLFSTWMCDAGGAEACLADTHTNCIPLQGGLQCHTCFPGYEPVESGVESLCSDIDECDADSELCGSSGVCEDIDGSYNCRCYVGYVSDLDARGECVEEFSGWTVQMIYQAKESQTFLYYFKRDQETPADYSDQTFVATGLHDALNHASKIMLVIHDENNIVREQLVFSGGPNAYEWFSASNLQSSKLWEKEKLKGATVFEFTDDDDAVFRIATEKEDTCEEVGFLRMTCDSKCDQTKWWLEDATLQHGQSCGIAYSTQEYPVDYIRGA